MSRWVWGRIKGSIHTIHFHKQLVEGVLLLTLTTEVSSPSLPANRINLIDEKDAWSVLPRHSKHVPDLKETRLMGDLSLLGFTHKDRTMKCF